MTLICNEIYLLDGVKQSLIVSIADSRLTYNNIKDRKKRFKKGTKLFKIEYLNATISFWGSVQISADNNKYELLCTWIPKFITSRSHHTTLTDFGNDLRNELNSRAIKDHLKDLPSGVHLCGYRKDGIPEFIHFSNCSIKPNGFYENITDSYKELEHDFLSRDAKEFGWDGVNAESISVKNKMKLYRNGEIRAHSVAWDKLDEVFDVIFKFDDFKKPYASSNDDIKKLTKQKLTFISSIYNTWMRTTSIGAPWDIIILRPKNS